MGTTSPDSFLAEDRAGVHYLPSEEAIRCLSSGLVLGLSRKVGADSGTGRFGGEVRISAPVMRGSAQGHTVKLVEIRAWGHLGFLTLFSPPSTVL